MDFETAVDIKGKPKKGLSRGRAQESGPAPAAAGARGGLPKFLRNPAQSRARPAPTPIESGADGQRQVPSALSARDGSVAGALAEVNRSAPALARVLTDEQLRQVQERLDIRASNAVVRERMENAKARMRARDGRYWHVSTRNQAVLDRIRRGFTSPEAHDVELVVDTARLLSPEILADQGWNVAAETLFRDSVWAELTASPTFVLWSFDREGFDYFWERKLHMRHTGGIVSFKDLLTIDRFRERYRNEVENSPAITATKEAYGTLESTLETMRDYHWGIIERNLDQPVVRRISEQLGGPDFFDMVKVIMKLKADPADAEAKAKFEHMTGVSNATQPRISEWKPIDAMMLLAYGAVLKDQPELAALAIAQAETGSRALAQKMAWYEERALGGAAAAVGFLEKVKFAGEIAATVAGGGLASKLGYGVVGVAVGTGVGGGAYEAATGIAGGLDAGEIAKRTGFTMLFNTLTGLVGGGFAAKINTRLLSRGFSPRFASIVSEAVGNASASFYTAPVEHVLRRMASGELSATSLEDMLGLVVDEAAAQAVTSALVGAVLPTKATGVEPPGSRLDIGTADTWLGSGAHKGDTLPGRPDTVNDLPTSDTVPVIDPGLADTVPAADPSTTLSGMGPGRPPGGGAGSGSGGRGSGTLPGMGPGRPPGTGSRTLPGMGPGRPPGGPPNARWTGRPFNPREAGRWWTDGERVFESVNGQWIPRGSLPRRTNFRDVSFGELRVRNGQLQVRRNGRWVTEGPYPTTIPPDIAPTETIRGEVRLNREAGRWEVNVEGTWHDIGPAPDLPDWARRPRR